MIRNIGRPGRGPKVLPTLRKGMLTMYGYSTAASPVARQRALLRAISQGGQSPLSVLRRLKVIQTYTRRSQKKASQTYGKNYNWLHSKYY